MTIIKTLAGVLVSMLAMGGVSAHGAPAQKPSGLSWQSWHMLEEHQLDNYDADLFFKIHDLQNKGVWEPKDILYVYGLTRDNIVGDGSGMGEHTHEQETISEDSKRHVVNTILTLMDTDGDGLVSLDEFRAFIKSGKELPDFGYGQGHHLDFESEYEEHHWNKFHAKDDPEVHVKHKEDIEHELLHHQHEMEESHRQLESVRDLTQNFLSPVRLENLPKKYGGN